MKKSGFTLIELLVVISIIALLSSVVLASLNSARDKAEIAAGRHFAAQIEHAAGEQALAIWDFDECSGSTSADRSGFSYDGAMTGATYSSNTPTGSGCSASFDGVDDVILTSYAAGDQPVWTMMAWVFDSKANNAYRAIIQTNVASDDALYIYPGNYIAYWPCGATPTAAYFPSNKWIHVAATYDGTDLKYYMNGIHKGTRSGACADATDWDFLRIGGHGTGDGERWQGRIDSVRIFTKTMTASEIQDVYASEADLYVLAQDGADR